MWTYFYDRSQARPQEEWWTTITGTLEREERAYFLRPPQPIAEPAPTTVKINLQRGERVRIKDGPFESFEGIVEEIYEMKGRWLVKVMLIIFNRPTPVDVEHWQVERL